MPKNEPFGLIWCDLFLAKNFSFDLSGNLIGILENQICSWSFENGVLKKQKSSKNGVAGFFVFKNKDEIHDVPKFGSFTNYLSQKISKKQIAFKALKMRDCKELGTLKAFKNQAQNRCRPYNKLEFSHDKVRKIALTKEAQFLINKECAWYSKMQDLGFKNIPKIHAFSPLTLSKIKGENVFLTKLNLTQKAEIIAKFKIALNVLHSFKSKKANKKDLMQEYYLKTIKRLNSIKPALPFANEKFIKINDKIYKNPLHFKAEFKELVRQNLLNTKFCLIHGDLTLTNTLLNEKNELIFIDPRGYFGSQEIFGDIRYDYAKLYFSMNGNFDNFNIKKFKCEILENEVKFYIISNGFEFLADELIKAFNKNEIRLIHAIIWLSMASHAWEDYDSMCVAFFKGVELLGDFLGGEKC